MPLHCPVRWLSGGKNLEEFVRCDQSFSDWEGAEPARAGGWEMTCETQRLVQHPRTSESHWRCSCKAQTKPCSLCLIRWRHFCQKWRSSLVILKLEPLVTPDTCGRCHHTSCQHQSVHSTTHIIILHQYRLMFSFLINPHLAFPLLERIGIEEFEMQHIKFKACSLWTCKFTELCNTLENAVTDQGASIVAGWDSLPVKFAYLKRVVFAVWSTCMC